MEHLTYINKNSLTNRITLMRSIFLRSLALIYLIAFLSFYRQLQGLWGDEGISPAKLFINNNKNLLPKYLSMLWMHLISWGSLLKRVLPFINLGSEIENYFYVICLIGILFSFLIVINCKRFINTFSFFLIWFCYLNFYAILQNFKYEVDTLLLEVGFIAIFFSPLNRRNFNVITVIDNICYYFLRLLLFKVMFGVGIHVLGSKCPYWLSVDGLRYYFQSQPLPNGLSVSMHNLPDGLKKLLSVLGYFIILYLPFGYFLVWRRFNIFAGQLTALFQLFIMLSGNYGHLQLIILTINLSNFDDYYLYSVIPNSIIRMFNLEELEKIVTNYLNEMYCELKKKKQKGKMATKDFVKENITADEERIKFLQEITASRNGILGSKNSNNDEEESGKIEELFLDENSRSSILKETFTFLTILSVIMVIIVFYLFPLKKILTEKYSIPELSIKSWEYILNIYMILLLLYFIGVIAYNLIQRFKIFSFGMEQSYNQDSDDTMSQIITGLSFLYYFLYYLFFICVVIMYYLGNVNAFYSGIGLSLIDKKNDNQNIMKFGSPFRNLFDKTVLFSDAVFKKVYGIHTYYGIQRKIRGNEGRSELEIDYLNEAGSQWETIEFNYKINIKSKPKTVMPYLPRLDYLMTKAAYSESINSSTWLAILVGKIFEKNPVVMDLLGYEIPQKTFYYKMSLFDRITNAIIGISRKELPAEIKKIKIESYLYEFVNKTEVEDKIMKRKHNWEFLGNIEKYAINPIFQRASLPEIIQERNITISAFQLLPIIDLLIVIMLLRLLN